jgi:hypothetical protein
MDRINQPVLADGFPPTRSGTLLVSEEIELSILMPCLNEVRTLEPCIRKALGFLQEHGVCGEVIVADNGSTDGSRALAERLGARVVPVEIPGYGAALAGGIQAARGRFVIMGDSDESYDFSRLMPFVEKLREGFELVMGNRFRGGIVDGAMPSLHRYFGNPFLTAIGRLFFHSRCGDFYCGQRGFVRDTIVDLDLQTTGMEFALEMLVKATLTGAKITEVPVTLSPDGRDRAPHLRSWRDGWRSLRFYLLYSPRWLFLYPGLVLSVIGLIAGILLLAGPKRIAGITLDVHTLMYCSAAIAVGSQLVFFSVFAKFFAIVTGLHPRRPSMENLFLNARIEIGIICGAVLLVAGLAGTLFAAAGWAGHHFGNLDPFLVMRVVIPSVLALTLGCQIIFSSLYFGLLQIQCRKLTGHLATKIASVARKG